MIKRVFTIAVAVIVLIMLGIAPIYFGVIAVGGLIDFGIHFQESTMEDALWLTAIIILAIVFRKLTVDFVKIVYKLVDEFE